MTKNCIERLKRLRDNADFDGASLELLIYECIKCSDAEEVRMVVDMVASDIESGADWLELDA